MSNNETAIMLITELGQAIRGDWGSIDGRNIRDDLNRMTALIDSDKPIDVEWHRGMANLCPHGNGHWTDYCEDGEQPNDQQ